MTSSQLKQGRYSVEQVESGISIPKHDYVAITYNVNNDPTVVTYRAGGPSGIIVASLALTYDGSNNLTGVQRTS